MENKSKNEQVELSDFTKAILENITGMLAYWNKDLRCEFANSGYLRWLGITPDQMQGIHIQRLLGEELFLSNEPYIRAVLTGENQEFERKLVTPKGEVAYGLIQYIAHKEDNEVQGFFALVTNITKQKNLEISLVKKTHLLKTINIINSMLVRATTIEDAMLKMCKILVEEGSFSMAWFGVVNESTKEIEQQAKYGDQFGYLEGIRVFVDTPPEKDGPISIAIRTKKAVVVQDAKNDPRLAQWASQRSKTNWNSSIALPILTDNTRAVFVAYNNQKDYFEDEAVEMLESVVANMNMFISRKQAEQQLLLSAKLASLGEMSAGIAHEINNPLMIISGSLKLFSRHAGDPEKLTTITENIQKSCERITKIVQGLKKFSRHTEGGEYKSHSLAKIIKEAITLTGPNAKGNSVEFVTALSSGATILCDEIEIEQVVINLINNAIDAIKEKEEKWIKIELIDMENAVLLRVIDSGLGIPKEIQKKIFDPFFTTKRIGEGTGLGLSVSKGILEKHRATIDISSKMLNTCFEIIFPKVEH